MFNRILFNLIQVAVVVAFAPLLSGVTSRLKEMIQSKRGPSIFQPYRDLWKLFHKDQIVSEESSWIFRFTPYLVFVVPIFVTLLIPVLTDYPLFFAFMGDMLGGGFVLSLGGFFATLAAVDTANPYGPMGASRTRMVSFLAEPVFMIVFFTVSFVAGSTIPFVVQQHWVRPLANLGLLAMENSAFFAGIGVAPEMPLIAEVSIAFDVVILVFIVSVLTHAVHEHIGTTEVGALTTLKEEDKP